MNEHKLFASVALFRNLYDNNRDIYDVIAEFVKTSITIKKKRSFSSTEIRLLLQDLFEFNLPDAVIKSVLRDKLIKSGHIKFDSSSGIYLADYSETDFSNSVEEEIATQEEQQNIIIQELYTYGVIHLQRELTTWDKEEIFRTFREYIVDNATNEKYSYLISSFIISRERDSLFKETLNAIKEGLIIYEGIRFSSVDIKSKSWNSNLTVYLSTEHLFNAAGFNGELYKNIFDDFFNLVAEINRNSQSKNQQKKISLKFFPEDKTEVDSFFYVAELIVQNKATLDPSKTAMTTIVNGCKSKSEVLEKKARFIRDLEIRGITEEKDIDILDYPRYNVVDTQLMQLIEKQSKENKKEFDAEEVERFLNIFTKINILRKGRSSVGFENVGYIFMSGKSVCHFLAHNIKVKFGEKDVPFSTDIDYITNKLWFKLKKGLGNSFATPKSLDISTKAKIILSSQLNESVAAKFTSYTEKYKLGEINKEDLLEYNNIFRERASKPENITFDTLDITLSFLNDTDLTRYSEEKAILKRKAEEGDAAIKELNRRKFLEKSKKKRSKKMKVSVIYFAELFSIYLLLTGGLVYFIYSLVEKNDTKIGILGVFISLLLIILSATKVINISNRIKKRACSRYLKYLNNMIIN